MFSLRNFSPSPSFYDKEETQYNTNMANSNTHQETAQELKNNLNFPEVFNIDRDEIEKFSIHRRVNSSSDNNSDIKVYVRCASEAKNIKQQCARILLPEQKSLVISKQESLDTSSIELYNVNYVFDNDTSDNYKIFNKMCQPYLQQIINLELKGYKGSFNGDNNNVFHPCFVTFGRTNSGKTHSVIGNVDEMDEKPLNGILVQFVSKLFEAFKQMNKPCNIKICGLEEYGETLNTLKLYDLFAQFNNAQNKLEDVIGSPPSKSKNMRPTFVNISDTKYLEKLMTDGCESIHCGLFDNKIVSCGHCLFQLKVNNKYFISFFDMAGYNPNYKLNNNIIPSNLTLNQFIQMLYHHHNEKPKQSQQNRMIYIPTQSIGLIPNLQTILFSNSDIIFLLHISDHIDHLEHTLKTLEIAKMFPNELEYDAFDKETEPHIFNKTLVAMDAYQLEEFEDADDDADAESDPDQPEEHEQGQEKGDLIFSPPPKIRMRKTHRASTLLLNNVKSNIDTIPIESRRQISSMPLEILQLKKSKNNADKTFLVPLGFSTYDAFVVKRENQNDNSLELHLRTNKSKFYIIIDNVRQFKDWIRSQIRFYTQGGIAQSDIDAEFEAMEKKEFEELEYDYSFKIKPIFVLSILMNILCFFILGSMDYIDVQLSFFEPFRESINRISREFEIIHDRYHQHQYQYNEMVSLYDELNIISSYCQVYIDSQETEKADVKSEKNHLFEFCESITSVHQTCPVDLLSIVQ